METTRRMPLRPLFRCVSAGLTDRGRVRSHNEDALFENSAIGLWAVADGAGGHGSGDQASQMIVESLAGVTLPTSAASFLADIDQRLHDVNSRLRARAAEQGADQVIASTVVILLIFGFHFACVWAGDSRLYRLRAGTLQRITRDHSEVQELVDLGLIDVEAASRLPDSNIITRAVGAHDELMLDRLQDEVSAGDIFLLCTDGLTKMLTEAEIARMLTEEAIADIPRVLVEETLKQGAHDNVTALAVACQPIDAG
jgi:serine/threonine-protein phosphatase Stp1